MASAADVVEGQPHVWPKLAPVDGVCIALVSTLAVAGTQAAFPAVAVEAVVAAVSLGRRRSATDAQMQSPKARPPAGDSSDHAQPRQMSPLQANDPLNKNAARP